MADHNCQEAFWMGNLKNRDLKVQVRMNWISVSSPVQCLVRDWTDRCIDSGLHACPVGLIDVLIVVSMYVL